MSQKEYTKFIGTFVTSYSLFPNERQIFAKFNDKIWENYLKQANNCQRRRIPKTQNTRSGAHKQIKISCIFKKRLYTKRKFSGSVTFRHKNCSLSERIIWTAPEFK